jgi:drug/metabolite transporter (DMT)-like permease
MKPRGQDYLLLHFIVLLWGFTSLLGFMLKPLTPMEVVFWRTLLAAACMWGLFYKRYQASPLIGRRLQAVAFNGFLIGIHWFLFFLAARVGNVSSCLAGIATGSVWSALLEPYFEKRKVQWEDLVSAVVVLIGLLIIFAGQADKAMGVIVGIASALFSSLFGIFNRRFVQTGSDVFAVSTVALTGAFGSTILLLPFAVWFGFQPTWVPQIPVGIDWLWLGLLAGVCTVFALTVSVSLGKRFTAFASSLAINMEPVYGIILARIILGQAEFMTHAFYLGTALILLAVLGHPVLSRRKGMPVAEVTGV